MSPEYTTKAILGLLATILAFCLNAWWASLKAANIKREEDACYRGEVRGHMQRMETWARGVNETLTEIREFKGYVNAFIRSLEKE